jgi:hypothetical protein
MAKTDTVKPARTRRSPQDVAVSELAKAEKRLERAQDAAQKWSAKHAEAEAEVQHAARYVDFLRQNPDLPQQDQPEPEYAAE